MLDQLRMFSRIAGRVVVFGVVALLWMSPSLACAEETAKTVDSIVIGDGATSNDGDTALPDLFTGTMSYQIPIEAPPGINGLQPALSLLYRSSNGNGWLGQGWEMEAGAIERSTRNGVANYTADDYVFRRAGAASELVSIGNGEFRSKIESDFMRIETSYCVGDICKPGNPNYLRFIATNKTGVKFYFYPQISGNAGIFRWSLGTIQDTSGNTINFTYQTDGTTTNGQSYLSQIDYNGNMVTFTLEGRTDTPSSTAAGFAIKTTKRLKKIDVRSKDGSLARSYLLNYQYGTNGLSKLISVTKYGKDGTTADLSQTSTLAYTYYNNIGDALTTITNSYGATTGISYIQPFPTQYTGTPPNPIPLAVKDITISDGNGNSSTTSYLFDGGFYYQPERDFRGFNHATVKGPVGPNGEQKVTETWFNQGNYDRSTLNVSTGYMKGKPYAVSITDGNGHAYRSINTTYAADRDGAAPWFNPPEQVDTYICDGDTTWGACDGSDHAQHLRTRYVYDSDYPAVREYGNLSDEYRHGDVNDATKNDKLTIHRTYSPNTSNWIIGLPASETIYQGIGTATPVAATSYYYDGVTDCSTASTNQTPTKGQLTRITRWLSGSDPEIRMAYDAFGNLICRRDANNNTTTIGYDPSNTFPVSVTSPPTVNAPSGLTTTTTYYGVNGVPADNGLYGQVKSVTDSNGVSVSNTYDALGRQTSLMDADGYSSWTYPPSYWSGAPYISLTTTYNGQYYNTNFDALLRPVIETRRGANDTFGAVRLNVISRTFYDARGKVSSRTLPAYAETEGNNTYVYAYDPLGRVIQVTSPDQANVLTCYDRDATITIDPNGHRKREVRDAYGRLVKVQEYTGTYGSCATEEGSPYATTTYEYDVLGNLLLVTDAKLNKTEMRYDTLGRKVYMSDPDMGVWTYAYDGNGNLRFQTDAKQQQIEFRYDALNRMVGKYYGATLVLSNRYDEPAASNGKGRLTSMSDASGGAAYNYDSKGRISASTKTVDGTAYPFLFEYYMGRLSKITYPDNETVNYTYGEAGDIKWVYGLTYDQAGNYLGWTDYASYSSHDVFGRPGTAQYGNGAGAIFTYDGVSRRLTGLSVASPTQTLVNNSYGYDNKGNITSINDRLNKPLPTNFTSESYTLDTARAHAVGSTGSGRSFQYDANGNIINDGRHSITYNFDNMPATIGNVSFTYDGNGTRVKKSSPGVTTVYIDKLYECTNGNCVKHIFAGDTRIAQKSAGVVLYYHPDHQGSTSVITDALGNKWEEIAYYPFGETRQDTGSMINLKYKYTGQELDNETGLYNYNARIYDPELGRFMTPDSIVPDPGNPQSLNRYSYTINNPLNYTDPSGHDFWSGLGELIGGVVLIAVSPYCPACGVAGAVLAGHGVSEMGGDSTGTTETPIVTFGGTGAGSNNSGGSNGAGGSGSNSGGVRLGNIGISYTGPGAATINSVLNGGSGSDIVDSLFSAGGNYGYGSYRGLSLGYGGIGGYGTENTSSGGIAIDFGGGYGSTKVPAIIHSAGNAGSGFYFGFNGNNKEYGAFSYQSTGVIDGVKLGAGANITLYNTNANNFFSGISYYRTTSFGPGSYSKYYSSNGDVIGRSLNVAGKGLGFGNEQGQSIGYYYPFNK